MGGIKLKKNPAEITIAVLLFALFGLAVLCSSVWHDYHFVTQFGPASSLYSYDSIAFDNEQDCFTVDYYPSELDTNKNFELAAFVNGQKAAFIQGTFSDKENLNKACFDSGILAEGKNKVDIATHHSTLFFQIEKRAGERQATGQTGIEIIEVKGNEWEEKRILSIQLENKRAGFIAPLEIFVNEKLDHRIYPKQNGLIEEEITLKELDNEIKVKFEGAVAAGTASFDPPLTMPPIYGLFLLVLAITIFSRFVFPSLELYKKYALSFACTAGLIVLTVFALGNLGWLGKVMFPLTFLAALLVIAIVNRKKAWESKPLNFKEIDTLVLFALLVFVFIATFFHITTFQHMTYWNGFYERMGAMIVDQNAIPVLDELSYFGRGYTFVPGYFYFNAGLSWITGLSGDALFAVIMAFANVLFFMSVFYLGKSLGLSKKQGAIFGVLMITESFLMTAISLSPRHTLAFSLFILSLALFFDRKKPFMSGIMLGLAGFIQAPLILFYPVFAFFASKKFDWKKTITAVAIAGAIFAVLFAPNLIRYGLPYQVESNDWGYLITVPLDYLYRDFAPVLGFFVLFYLVDLWKKRIKIGKYSKRLIIGVLAGFIIQTFVTYRYNIVTSLNIGLLLAMWFPTEKLKDVHFERIVIIFLAAAIWYALSMVSLFSVQGIATEPIKFIELNSAKESRILSDPLFGHAIAYFAERPVLADLHVEYADGQKLKDAYRFLEEKDYSLLEKYEIGYIVNQNDFINKQAIGGTLSRKRIEFDEIDKIYSNGFIYIHRNSGEWK